MKLVSVNVGMPREVVWRGRSVATGIFKEPVAGRVWLHMLNLEGDRQADLSVHGGTAKAVYGYPSEHYAFWQRELPGVALPFGIFGENFTTAGILEGELQIGDRFRIGTAQVQVTQPRLPCYKLGIKFGRDDIVKRFLKSGRTGFYFAVTQEGEVGAGDEFQRIARGLSGLTVPEVTCLYVAKKYDQENLPLLKRAAQAQELPESWRRYFQERLAAAVARPERPNRGGDDHVEV